MSEASASVGASVGGPADEVEAIAAMVSAQPGVARLSAGVAGVVGTYLPGHRVPGVRLTDTDVEVHVVARWVASLPDLADQLRTALQPISGGRAVSVFIDDLDVVETPGPDTTG